MKQISYLYQDVPREHFNMQLCNMHMHSRTPMTIELRMVAGIGSPSAPAKIRSLVSQRQLDWGFRVSVSSESLC